MKFLIYFFAIPLMYISTSLYAQEKGDNLIVIETNRSPEENFSMFGKHLVSQGYSFESKDVEFLSLVTNIKECRGGGGVYNYKMNISFSDNLIKIRVTFLASHLDPRIQPTWIAWTYTNYKGTAHTHILNDFDPKLRQYRYKLIYSKE